MRQRTEKEKGIMGVVETIFRNMKIDKNDPGYMPLLDAILYAYAYRDKSLKDIIETLSEENYYLGLRNSEYGEFTSTREKIDMAIVHIVKMAIEKCSIEYLEALELDKMVIILEGKRDEELENALIAEIGEEYSIYSNDEKIVFFFIKKILKAVKYGVTY